MVVVVVAALGWWTEAEIAGRELSAGGELRTRSGGEASYSPIILYVTERGMGSVCPYAFIVFCVI